MKDKNGKCLHYIKDRNEKSWTMLYDDGRGRMWECMLCGDRWGYDTGYKVITK